MSVSNLILNARKTTRQLFPELFSLQRRLSQKRQHKDGSHSDLSVFEGASDISQMLPSHTVLLGQCADGLPFLMQLGDPDIGAILISGEVGSGKTRQLQTVVDSAIRTHLPRELQIAILTDKPAVWDSIQSSQEGRKYLQSVQSWTDECAEQTIRQITELAEARRQGQRQGTDVFFLLDGFDAVEDLSYEAQVNLHWLLEYGSQSGVWVVGTIRADLAEGFRYWINTFRTRVVGWIKSGLNADILAMKPGSGASTLAKGSFRVWTGSSWLTYQLPPAKA